MEYFSDTEFLCGCGCGADITDALKLKLTHARRLARVPFVITSGARCTAHNASVGSKDTSSHIVGLAVDIKADGSRQRYQILNALINAGFNRIGIASEFLHCDIDTEKDKQVIWVYN